MLMILLSACGSTDEATWRYETTETLQEGEGTGEEEWEGEGEGEGEGGQVYEKVLWGATEGEESWTGLYFADPDAGGELCEVIFETGPWVPTDDCTDCAEAWTITRGEELVEIDVDGACEAEGWLGLGGTSFSIGYSEEAWLADLGGGWQEVDGGAGEEGEWLFFEIWLE